MLKFSKYNLLVVATIVLLFSACSSKEVTLGNKMMAEATALDTDDLLKKELAKEWNEGSKLIKKGNKNIEDGKELIEDAKDLEDEAVDLKKEAIDLEKEAKDLKAEGKDLIYDGEKDVEKGKRMTLESEEKFKRNFPDSEIFE